MTIKPDRPEYTALLAMIRAQDALQGAYQSLTGRSDLADKVRRIAIEMGLLVADLVRDEASRRARDEQSQSQ